LYDRYMKAGYAATDQKQYETALRYFRRALDERPNDSYSTQAIRNIESTLQPGSSQPIPQTSTPTTLPARPLPPAPTNVALQATR
jgi:tetratricopeptide (TPR) repeat protein